MLQTSCNPNLVVTIPTPPANAPTPDEPAVIKVYKYGETEHSIFGQLFKKVKITSLNVCIEPIIGDNALYEVWISAKINGTTYNTHLGHVFQKVYTYKPNFGTIVVP